METKEKAYLSVPSMENDCGVVFHLHDDCHDRRIVFKILKAYPASTSIVGCKSVYLGNVRHFSTRNNSQTPTKGSKHSLTSPATQNSPQIPAKSLSTKEWVSLPIVSVTRDSIVADWSVAHTRHAKFFTQKTRKGERITFSFMAELVLDDNDKPMQVIIHHYHTAPD